MDTTWNSIWVSLIHTTLEGPKTYENARMHDGCQVYMVSYMALNRSCFMVTKDSF